MNAVFLDSVGPIALWEQNDQWHIAAMQAFTRLLRSNALLVTTPQVLLECGNAGARRPYRKEVADLRINLEADGRLIVPSAAEEGFSWNIYRLGHPWDAGIVDQISFAVMRRLGMSEAFTNDKHFAAAGFTVLF